MGEIINSHPEIKNNPKVLSYHLLQIGLLKLFSGDKTGARDIINSLGPNLLSKENLMDVLLPLG
uniref:Glycosyl transferase n=1 Tax=Pyrococcus abyssi (strain GE5 / Orsay) TaxID=272844 RepID=G8ZKD9_PYRAB|nr:TPA: glycosyl transferase [Pyrococcus abyssi GE5]